MRQIDLVKFTLLLTPAVLVGAFMFFVSAGPSVSLAQNSNSSTTTNLNRSREMPKTAAPPPAAQDFSKNTWQLPPDADKTKNPVEATPESIAKGKEIYHERSRGNCIFCHGETGSGNEANKAVLRRKPADLTNKPRMTSMTDGEIFWKISKGIVGIMPSGETKVPNEEDRWHLVNYVRTLAREPQE